MLSLSFTYNGTRYENFTTEDAKAAGIPDHVIDKAIQDSQLAEIRNQRNFLLTDCDWTMLQDSSVSEEKRQEFIEYRQQLRDITEPLKSPAATFSIGGIQWPTKPEL
ncbi:MAG: phage tail assembly chaperone [Vibrionaceae bacterium]